jgi:hypothetical protein
MAAKHQSGEVNPDRFVLPDEIVSNDPFSKNPFSNSGLEESPIILSDSSPVFAVNPSSFEFINEESEQTSGISDVKEANAVKATIEYEVDFIQESPVSQDTSDEEHLEHQIKLHTHTTKPQKKPALRAAPNVQKTSSETISLNHESRISREAESVADPEEREIRAEDRNRARKTVVEFSFDEVVGVGYEEKGSFHAKPKPKAQLKIADSEPTTLKRKPKIQVRISDHKSVSSNPMCDPVERGSESLIENSQRESDEESNSDSDKQSKSQKPITSSDEQPESKLVETNIKNNPNLPAPAPNGENETPSKEESKLHEARARPSGSVPMGNMTGTAPPAEHRPKENAKVQEIKNDSKCGGCNIL